MNEITTNTTADAPVATKPAQAAPAKPAPDPKTRTVPRPLLSASDVQLLQEGLAAGRQPMATRRDLVELNKRLVEMLTTLNAGLSEQQTRKAEDDRRELSAKLEEMEQAVNAMEGLLRIELAPQFRMMLNESFEDHFPRRRAAWRTWAGAAAAALAGVAVGVNFSPELQQLAANALAAVRVAL